MSQVSAPPYRKTLVTLTQLSALARRLQQQPQLVQHQRHVHSVTPEPLGTEQEGHGRLELSRQEQHLEIQEGLLAGGEMRLSCWTQDKRKGVRLDVSLSVEVFQHY